MGSFVWQERRGLIQENTSLCLNPSLLSAQDSPTNKLLYAKEIPEYRKIVQRYYKQIHDMTPLSEQEMNAHLAEESRVRRGDLAGRDKAGLDRQQGAVFKQRVLAGPGLVLTMESASLRLPPCLSSQKYQNEFNTNVAMTEIYKYAKRYRPQVSSPQCEAPLGATMPPCQPCSLPPAQGNTPRVRVPLWHSYAQDVSALGVASSSGNPGGVFSPGMCSGTRGSWARALAQLPPLPPQIMSALEANPTARRTQLQHKFEQVVALMEDNIYECYSEA